MHAVNQEKLQRWTFLVLFIAIGLLFWKVAEPLWVPIFLGALIAIGTHPLHKKLVGKLGKKHGDSISAAAITAGVMTVCLALGALFSFVLLRQLISMVRGFTARAQHETPEQMLGPRLSDSLARLGENPARLQQHLTALSTDAAQHLAVGATAVLAASFGAMLIIIFTAITSYYLLRNGVQFTNWFVRVLPLPDGEVWELVKNFRDVAQVMVLGTGVTAFYQGISSGLGYWVAGVPNPLVWGVATGFASILPAIGSTIVWLPVSIWLMTQHLGAGIALCVWAGIVTVGVADYVIRPRLLGSKVKMNELVIFIALFGGIEAFGLLGTILGPIIAALLFAMIRIYQRDYRPGAPQPDETGPGSLVLSDAPRDLSARASAVAEGKPPRS